MNELDQVKDYLQSLQSRIVAELEQLDGKLHGWGSIRAARPAREARGDRRGAGAIDHAS